MEKESFEDEEAAGFFNDTFVCIKVDREERPDIDAVYMAACQMMTGSGGWPLTIFMTPEKKPFFAATYLPKRSRFGRAGRSTSCRQVGSMWLKATEKLLASADAVSRRPWERPSSFSPPENRMPRCCTGPTTDQKSL